MISLLAFTINSLPAFIAEHRENASWGPVGVGDLEGAHEEVETLPDHLLQKEMLDYKDAAAEQDVMYREVESRLSQVPGQLGRYGVDAQ